MSEQKISFTNKIKAPFTWVENDIIRSKSLSSEEIGLYLILRSFGERIYPSIDYLVDLTKIKKKRLYFCLKQLINTKLLIRKQTKKGKEFSNVEYCILSLNDNYEEIYKEFIGEEPENPKTLENAKSYSVASVGMLKMGMPKNDHTHIKKKKNNLKEKESHTPLAQEDKSVCENEISRIQKTKTFQNTEPAVIENLIKSNGKKTAIAAEYIEKTFSGQTVRNPEGLLIATLRNGLYSELPPTNNNINGLESDIKRLNEKFKGFFAFKGERIQDILNINGRIAFYTDNYFREIVYTPAKSYNEFESYLKRLNSS